MESVCFIKGKLIPNSMHDNPFLKVSNIIWNHVPSHFGSFDKLTIKLDFKSISLYHNAAHLVIFVGSLHDVDMCSSVSYPTGLNV